MILKRPFVFYYKPLCKHKTLEFNNLTKSVKSRIGAVFRHLWSKKRGGSPRFLFAYGKLFSITGTAACATCETTFLTSDLTAFGALLGAVAAVGIATIRTYWDFIHSMRYLVGEVQNDETDKYDHVQAHYKSVWLFFAVLIIQCALIVNTIDSVEFPFLIW